MTDYTKELTERSETLRAELQEMQKGFESKREEFLKLQGALEMLQVLDKDSKKAEDDD
jgi:chaperonin cofactor prefoldin